MRHKYIILGLLGLLIALVILKVYGPTHFPMSVKSDLFKREKVEKAARKFIEERIEASENTIKWAPYHIGDTRESLGVQELFIQNDTFVLGGLTVPCSTTYFFDESDRLIEVHISFTSSGIDIPPITGKVKEQYGKHYLNVYEYNPYLHRNSDDRFFWLDGNNLVLYEVEISLNKSYLSIMDISCLSQEQLAKFIRSVRINGYNPYQSSVESFFESENEKSSGRTHSSSTRTYKYGDSDIYQGSSQQKADLEAIDKYFGF